MDPTTGTPQQRKVGGSRAACTFISVFLRCCARVHCVVTSLGVVPPLRALLQEAVDAILAKARIASAPWLPDPSFRSSLESGADAARASSSSSRSPARVQSAPRMSGGLTAGPGSGRGGAALPDVSPVHESSLQAHLVEINAMAVAAARRGDAHAEASLIRLRTVVEQLLAQVDMSLQDAAAAKAKVAVQETTIEHLVSKLRAEQATVEDLRRSGGRVSDASSARRDQLEYEVRSRDLRITDLSDTVVAREAELQRMTAELEALHRDNEQLRRRSERDGGVDARKAEDAVKAVRAQLRSAETARDDLQYRCSELDAAVLELQQERARLQASARRDKDDAERLRQQLQRATAELQECQRREAAATSKEKGGEAAVAALRSQLSTQQQETSAASARARSLERQVHEYERLMEEMKAE
jgi:chromosome segregation ATPase